MVICTVSCIGPTVMGVIASEMPVSPLAAINPYTTHPIITVLLYTKYTHDHLNYQATQTVRTSDYGKLITGFPIDVFSDTTDISHFIQI